MIAIGDNASIDEKRLLIGDDDRCCECKAMASSELSVGGSLYLEAKFKEILVTGVLHGTRYAKGKGQNREARLSTSGIAVTTKLQFIPQHTTLPLSRRPSYCK